MWVKLWWANLWANRWLDGWPRGRFPAPGLPRLTGDGATLTGQ